MSASLACLNEKREIKEKDRRKEGKKRCIEEAQRGCRIPMLRLHSTAPTIDGGHRTLYVFISQQSYMATYCTTTNSRIDSAMRTCPASARERCKCLALEGCSCSLTSWSTPLRYSRTPLCRSSIADITSSVRIIPFLGSHTYRGDLWFERIICARIIHLLLNDRKYYEHTHKHPQCTCTVPYFSPVESVMDGFHCTGSLPSSCALTLTRVNNTPDLVE